MSDDANDDDPQLTSLRAVWLSMPDEEPPQRGLAELMAAARMKADEMAKPSLWERIVALLRRPPVLALATVLVLIGGAVFIGQRRAAMEAEGPVVAADQQLREANMGSAATATTTQYVPTADPVAPSQAASPAPDMVAPSGADKLDNDAEAPAATPPRVNRRAGATHPTDTTRTRGAKARDDGAKHEAPAAGTQLELGTDERGGGLASDRFAAPPPEAQQAQGEKVQAPKTDAAATKKATTKNEDAPSETVVGGASAPQDRPTSTTSSSSSGPSRASQYVAQAKSAAARGDCNVAKTMMKRVAGEDAAAYRNALAGDAALRKCVGVPAAQ
jgi:hypothetical protein